MVERGDGKRRLFFDDFRVGDVRELGSFSLTKDDIISFAEKWDPHPWHVDEDAASDAFFGGIVASGVHSFAAFSSLMTGNFLIDAAVSAGREVTMQLKAPIRPDQEIHARATVVEVEDVPRRPDQGLVVFLGENLAADGGVVMTVRLEVLIARRPVGV
jgi:acyl dehydratase